jgi:hypothetical protein
MAKARPDTISVKGDSWVNHEADAAVALTPGEFVTFDSAGDFALPAAGDTLKMIVIEDDLQGNEISDDYAATNNTQARVFQPGSIVQAILTDGQNVPIGRELELDGNGTLITVGSNEAIAMAFEAIDASDSAATPVASRRILVVIL